MATQASIQAAIFRGYGKAAAALGVPFNQYRATGPNNPLSGPVLASLPAAFDADPKFSFKAPTTHSKPLVFGLFDGTNVQVFDYLTHPTQGIVFVAGYEPCKPMLCVSCNRTLTFTRPASALASGYSARQSGTDTSLAAEWPASVLAGSKADTNPVGLPDDVRTAWVAILLPAIAGVVLRYGDLATDDLNRRLVLSNVELTGLGYRITATYAGA